MPVTDKRFSISDNETNLPVTDFMGTTSSCIRGFTDGVSGAIGGIVGGISSGLESLISGNAFDDLGDFLGGLENDIGGFITSGLKDFEINNLIDDLFKDNDIAPLLRQLDSECKFSLFSGYDPCDSRLDGQNSSKRKACSSDTALRLVQSEAGEAYTAETQDSCALYNKFLMIGKAGSASGLLNSFQALESSVPQKGIMLAVGTKLATDSARDGNIYTVADVAASGIGRGVITQNPSIVTQTVSGFKLPDSSTEMDYSDIFSLSSGALGNLDPTWNSYSSPSNTTYPSSVKISNASSSFNDVFASSVSSSNKITSSYSDASSFGTAVDTNAYLKTATTFGQQNSISALKNSFSFISL